MTLSRREVLQRGLLGAGALALGGPALAACSSSGGNKPTGSSSSPTGSSSSSSSGAPTATVGYQLAWLNSVQFGGSYLAAQQGYWSKQGLKVTLSPGGPNVAGDAQTVSGKALMNISSADGVARSNAQGADLKIVGHQYQKAPQVILSLAKKAIKTPKDLEGKRLGAADADRPGLEAFAKAAGFDLSKVKLVPSQYDPAPLIAGQVDALYCFAIDLPVALQVKGYEGYSMLLSDFGYNVGSQTYTVLAKTLDDPTARAHLKSLLIGDIQGWELYRKNTDAAAELTVKDYPNAGLNLKTQKVQAKVQVPLMFDAQTDKSGFAWFSDEDVSKNLALFKILGIKGDKSLWDRSLLEEIYKSGPTV